MPIIDDIVDEHDETFLADLSAATEPAGSPGQITDLTITDASANVTIQDADLAPVLQIQDPAPIVEGGTRTVTVTLVGASGDGVTVDVASTGGTAIAGSDYNSTTATWSANLVWAADETGNKTFDVVTLDNAPEEDAESVILKLFNASSTGADGVILLNTTGVAIGDLLMVDPTLNSALRSDGVQADATAVLQINDDEPAVKVVTIVSDPEGMPGDPYFLVFTGMPSPDPGVVAIGSVPELLQRAFGLDEVRSKAATHVAMGMVTTSDPLGPKVFNFTIGTPVSTSLNVVQQRTNRSFYLFPGPNFTGLGLVPDDPSIANQLTQTVPNANQALIDAIKAGKPDNTELDRDVVKLDDVVEIVWAFNADAVSPAFKNFVTSDPLTGSGASSGSLTDLAPFQGMIIMTREDATGSSGPVPVFDEATASLTLHAVPVRLDIEGPFLSPTATAPVSSALSKGFNLIAPHIWADTPFDTVFAGSGDDISEIFSSAVARWRAIQTYDPTSVDTVDKWLTESASIPPFIGPGTIFPELSYWIKVATTVTQDPVLTATGPNIGGGP